MITMSNSGKKEQAADANNTSEGLDHAGNSLRSAASDAGHLVREFLHEKSDQASELRHTAEDKITQYPIRSVALAAFGGLVLGALLRR